MASIGFFGASTRSSSTKPIAVKSPVRPTTKARARVCRASYAPSVYESYKTLRIERGASESDVKKAFRKLALQYHPDVCRGGNCDVKFHTISEAYDVVMSDLRDVASAERSYDQGIDEPMRGMNDPDYDLWEEWMGWEGAGIRDYSSHINPYI